MMLLLSGFRAIFPMGVFFPIMGGCKSKMRTNYRLTPPVMGQINLSELPEVILQEIISYLDVHEALSLSLANKRIKAGIGLSVICPGLHAFDPMSWHGDVTGDLPKRGPEIFNLFGGQTHTIRFRCSLVDQGWGKFKGQLYIVAAEDGCGEGLYDPLEGFDDRRLVAASPVAQHLSTTVNLTFQPKAGQRYHLWHKAGGGGGHWLHVANAEVIYIVQGDGEEQGFKNAVTFLNSLKLWGLRDKQTYRCFHRELVSAASKSMRTMISQGNEPHPLLAALFQFRGIECVNKACLESLEVLLSNLTVWYDSFEMNQTKKKIQNNSTLDHTDLDNHNFEAYEGNEGKKILKLRPGLCLFHSKTWGKHATGGIPRRGPEIPNLFGDKTHSIDVHFDFADEGYGNLVGQISIVADKSGDVYDPVKGFQNQKVVATSPDAQRESSHVTLTFQPKSGEKYHIWYTVGGGGGHKLHVSNVEIIYSIQSVDEEQNGLISAVSFLYAAGLWIIPTLQICEMFCRAMVAAAAQSMRSSISKKGTPDTTLEAMFHSYGMESVDETSLKALEFLLGNLDKYSNMEGSILGRSRRRRFQKRRRRRLRSSGLD